MSIRTDLADGRRVVIDSVPAQYKELCQAVLGGRKVQPRGMTTWEVTDVTLEFRDLARTYPAGIGRKASTKILAAETCQWIAGVSDLAQLDGVSRGAFNRYSDDGTRLYGAYGPRARGGLERAVDVLERDPDSRQAVVSLWRTSEVRQTRDLPCTLSWTFRIRDGRLDMATVMRSNDLWTGLTYDVPAMTRIQTAVAWALRLEPGSYVHQVGSLHIYEPDADKVSGLGDHDSIGGQPPPFTPDELVDRAATPDERWRYVRAAALSAKIGRGPSGLEWYGEQLAGSEQNPYLCSTCHYFLPQPELACATPAR